MKNQSGVGGHLGAERGLAAAADLGEGVRGHCAGGCLLLHAHTARGRAAVGTGKHALQQVVFFQQPAILFRTRKKTASPIKSAVSAAICTAVCGLHPEFFFIAFTFVAFTLVAFSFPDCWPWHHDRS